MLRMSLLSLFSIRRKYDNYTNINQEGNYSLDFCSRSSILRRKSTPALGTTGAIGTTGSSGTYFDYTRGGDSFLVLLLEGGVELACERNLLDLRLIVALGLGEYCFTGERGKGCGTSNSKDLRVEIWLMKGLSAS